VEECTQDLVIKPDGKRPLARPRHRWEHNIEMNRREIASLGMYRIHVAQNGPMAGSCENGKKPGSIQCGKFLSSRGTWLLEDLAPSS
jgi:hypothetical protein